ncbi:MAG: alpha/beta hydrolase family protein [Janthinobacterium lividum]
MKFAFALLTLTLPLLVNAQEGATTLPGPPPGPRASMESFQIPSHGALLNAFVYVAAGTGPHPAVVLLHGFPGNEKNLDLAQSMRRAGWDVLFFNYRGSWGSPGDFSFEHSIEDTAAAVAYLRVPSHAKALRLDPQHIVLMGHSMGGFMAVQAAAHDPSIAAVGLISAADMAGRIPAGLPLTAEASVVPRIATSLAHEGMSPLAGCTPEGIAHELFTHAAQWSFTASAAADATRPTLVVTSDDGLGPANDAFALALRDHGDKAVTATHLNTDHAYSDERLQLTDTVLRWLRTLPFAPLVRI